LYRIMDYLNAEWHPKLIREWLDLKENQIIDVINYIDDHRNEFESEYRSVLKQSEDNRKYWEECNRERFEAIAASHSGAEDICVGPWYSVGEAS